MIRIYKGQGHTDAYLVRDWLERNGVRAFVRGENRLGAIGEIPLPEAWPGVYVAKADQQRATECLRLFEGPALVHPEWACARCGEANGPAFGSCWSCGHDRSP